MKALNETHNVDELYLSPFDRWLNGSAMQNTNAGAHSKKSRKKESEKSE